MNKSLGCSAAGRCGWGLSFATLFDGVLRNELRIDAISEHEI